MHILGVRFFFILLLSCSRDEEILFVAFPVILSPMVTYPLNSSFVLQPDKHNL